MADIVDRLSPIFRARRRPGVGLRVRDAHAAHRDHRGNHHRPVRQMGGAGHGRPGSGRYAVNARETMDARAADAAMRRTPEISIITPTFDAAASLPRMLDSVSRQKLSDWEHIIVIDGAYDDSLAIATAAAALDARIRVIEQANAGASAARNRGIDAARGTWLLFLDADDTIAPSHLKRLLARGARDADVVCSGYIRRDAAGRKVGTYRVPPLDADPFRAIVEMPPTAIHAILVRRDAVRAVGGFDPALRTNEDWDLW